MLTSGTSCFRMSQQRKSDCRFTWKTCVGYLCSGCVQCSILLCYGATVEGIEQDQHEEDIGVFVAFRIKSLEGFAILDGGATKTVSGFISVQPVADQYDRCWLYVRWRNGGSEHVNLYTTHWVPARNVGECCVERANTVSHRLGRVA